MKSSYILISLLLVISIIQGCEEEVYPREYPRVSTGEVTNISFEGATFKAEVIYRGEFEILSYGFVWAAGINPTLENSNSVVYTENLLENEFSSSVSSTIGRQKEYYVRSFVETKDYLVYGNNVMFIRYQ